MSDVRSLLKDQRSARQIRHPHAIYTPKEQLSCSICRLTLKSDSQWESHLRSDQHVGASKAAQTQRRADTSGENGSKKRKANDDEDASSKRVRSDSIPSRPRPSAENPALAQPHLEEDDVDGGAAGTDASPDSVSIKEDPAQNQGEDRVDDEMEAFEREMAKLEQQEEHRQQQPPNAVKVYDSAPAISAEPLTAAALAARDREEKSAQKSARDIELEEEREEAAGQLQDEVDRMNKFDEKIKELRARKDALNQARSSHEQDSKEHADMPDNGNVDDEESQSEDEDFDEWKFGKS